MKKTKSIFCTVLLSTVLVGNVFAGDFTGYGVWGFFDSVMNTVVLLIRDGGCERRQCQTCRPIEEGGEGNCRPTSN